MNGRIMFPSTHDITPENLEYYMIKLNQVLDADNNVLIVTKPHFICIKNICDKSNQYKESITFRFTIGSINSEVLKFWEPYAPSFEERLSSLQYAFFHGYKTSVSCEPMLDNNTEELVEQSIPFVNDSIWIGKANHLKSNLGMNKYHDSLNLDKAEELLRLQSNDYFLRLYEKYMSNSVIE